jgi:Tol biopolymer transport system component
MTAGQREAAVNVVNADGSGVTKVARGGFPTWSPDGTRIAFLAASKEGGNEIRIANADGTGEMTVTEGGGSLDLPAWSPDGSRIAYITWAKGEGPQLYVVNPDRTDVTRLTDLRSDGMGGYSPSWSPDGSTIAIEVFEDGNWNLYLVNADGSGVRPLTDLSGDENRPTWAPDGTRIAFMGSAVASSEGENTGSFDVYLIDPDGTDLQKLTDGAGAASGSAHLATTPRLRRFAEREPECVRLDKRGSVGDHDRRRRRCSALGRVGEGAAWVGGDRGAIRRAEPFGGSMRRPTSRRRTWDSFAF